LRVVKKCDLGEMNNPTIIIGYSGHAYVVLDILVSQHYPIIGYCDSTEKSYNPFNINYLGKESDEGTLSILAENHYFVSIGDNYIRAKVLDKLTALFDNAALNVIHAKAVCSNLIEWHPQGGILVAANATINPLVKIGKGVICNTSCSIDHECILGNYVHIAPNAVLCGNVKVGDNSFIGANSVIKQGIIIGKNAIIGAGSVILNNVPDNVTIVGNPGKIIKSF
jgi:sugar O-acyltransferase (sialic acid O-acetyltransferase NeuD family)